MGGGRESKSISCSSSGLPASQGGTALAQAAAPAGFLPLDLKGVSSWREAMTLNNSRCHFLQRALSDPRTPVQYPLRAHPPLPPPPPPAGLQT